MRAFVCAVLITCAAGIAPALAPIPRAPIIARARAHPPVLALGDGPVNGELQPGDGEPPPGDGDGELPGAARIGRALSSPSVEVLIATLVFIATSCYTLQTLPQLDADQLRVLGTVEDSVSAIFAAEYFARWWSSSLRPGFLVKPLNVIDFLSFAPLLLRIAMPEGEVSTFAFLRLLRVLRLQRFVADEAEFAKFERALGVPESEVRPYQLQVARVVTSIFTLLLVSTGLIYEAEHAVNPAIPDYFTALYFGLTTLTTVGFGDIVPVTTEGRLVVCASILAGVAVIPFQLSSLGEALLSDRGADGDGDDKPTLGLGDAASAVGSFAAAAARAPLAAVSEFTSSSPPPQTSAAVAADAAADAAARAAARRAREAADAAGAAPAPPAVPSPAAASEAAHYSLSDEFAQPTSLTDVAAFHRTFGAPVVGVPAVPPADRAALRLRLLREELDELEAAVARGDIVDAADAIIDLEYVLAGAALEFGVGRSFAALWREVHRSNMSKACDSRAAADAAAASFAERGVAAIVEEVGGRFVVLRASDRKVLKPPGYSRPELRAILAAAGATPEALGEQTRV